MRNTLSRSLVRPEPSDMLKCSSTTSRKRISLWPSGISTAVSELEYSAGLRQRISRFHARTARRAASAWRS
ncbi:hypothetical protein D3C83_193900 [compost metagenome]